MNAAARTIRAVLDDGPRAGQELTIDAEPDGRPPQQVAISDPLALEPTQDGPDPGARPVATTTYHLHGPGDSVGSYVYRTGHPD